MIHHVFLGAIGAFHSQSLRLGVLSNRLEGIYKQDALGIGTQAFRVHGDCFFFFFEDTRFAY